jgi:predicted transcriptional regulator
MKNELGFDEIADTLKDLHKVAETVEDRLKDGFQLTDSFALVEIYPRLQEVYEDRQEFLAEFKDLTPDEAAQVIDALAEQIGDEPSKVEQRILQVLTLTGSTYAYLKMVIGGGKDLVQNWALFLRPKAA